MTLAEIIAEVYAITNRPDLVTETAIAIRKATMKLHAVDTFPRDFVEVNLTVLPAATAFQIDVTMNLLRLRAVAYVRDATDIAAGTNNKFFQHIEPRELMDEYQLERNNIWYQGGVMLNVKSSTSVSNVLVGYYENPVVTDAGFASWIALEQPYAIIEEAAATIFRMIGDDNKERFYSQQSVQNIVLLRQNYLEGVAR